MMPTAVMPSCLQVVIPLVATTFAPGTLYNSSSSLQAMVCTGLDSVGAPLGYTIPFDKTAVANVEYKSDGTYALDFKGQCSSKLDGAAFQNIHVTYNGAITFANQDPKSYDLAGQGCCHGSHWQRHRLQ